MKKNMTISVVMCTYNGASRHLDEQLDSLFSQTLLPDEIIVQDDCSSDDTPRLLRAYADKAPAGTVMRVFRNDRQQGINRNFFSAMRRATSRLIAVCDQDDIWLPTKLEEQASAIGDKLMCVCRSEPFSETGAPVRCDRRLPNCNLLRLFYASMMGHCQMFRRELLDVLPSEDECTEIFRRTCYDVMTATAAAALDSIVLLDRFLVRQRRYDGAATYVRYDAHRTRSADNALFMAWYGVRHYRAVKPWMNAHFEARRSFLEWVWRKAVTLKHAMPPSPDAPSYSVDNAWLSDGLRLLDCECRHGMAAFFGLLRMYMKHRHHIFYTYEKDPAAMLRALLHPFMQIYNYSYLVGKKY